MSTPGTLIQSAEPEAEQPLPPEATEIDWDRAEPVQAQALPSADGLTCRLTVRFDGRTVDALAAETRRLGFGPATLVRMWTLERLQEKAGVAGASTG